MQETLSLMKHTWIYIDPAHAEFLQLVLREGVTINGQHMQAHDFRSWHIIAGHGFHNIIRDEIRFSDQVKISFSDEIHISTHRDDDDDDELNHRWCVMQLDVNQYMCIAVNHRDELMVMPNSYSASAAKTRAYRKQQG